MTPLKSGAQAWHQPSTAMLRCQTDSRTTCSMYCWVHYSTVIRLISNTLLKAAFAWVHSYEGDLATKTKQMDASADGCAAADAVVRALEHMLQPLLPDFVGPWAGSPCLGNDQKSHSCSPWLVIADSASAVDVLSLARPSQWIMFFATSTVGKPERTPSWLADPHCRGCRTPNPSTRTT